MNTDTLTEINPDLMAEWEVTQDPQDPWGSAVAWLFGVADFLHFETNTREPEAWHYKPGMTIPDWAPDDDVACGYEDAYELRAVRYLHERGMVNVSDLVTFGNWLHHRIQTCEDLGVDY